jgi:asparagine synthase (glutamine-hydrolysing)
MCGIAGFNGKFSPESLNLMGKKIAHRGPDSSGVFYSQEHFVGLMHQRLAIIDLSPAGSQPMCDLLGQVAVVFNGEIYNFKELRSELLLAGFNFRGNSDTEVLLNLYLQCGEEMLCRLNGVFAFAIWDCRTRSIFIARDGLGVKPLYYSKTSSGFIFASELKALLENPEVKREIDPHAVLMHLTYLWCPAPSTILKSVQKLPPGHAMQIRDGDIHRIWKYYELPYDQPIEALSVDSAAFLVEQTLKKAVERQMVSDVPVGAFLSGGLDSSAIVAFAKQVQPDVRLQCFTIGLKDGGGDGFADDLPYAQKVAKHLGVDLHTIHVGSEMADQLQTMIYHLDEPLADPAPLNALFISQLAREHGIKVLLSGAGGDDIFSGYRRHYALQQERYWSWSPEWARSLLASGISFLPTGQPALRRLRKAFEYADLNEDERLCSYFYWGQPSRLEGLLSKAYRRETNSKWVSKPLLDALQNIPQHTDPLNRMLFLESKFFLPDHNLNYTDKMSMAVGVEVRVPLLDPDLVSLAARLPIKYKQNGREGKWIFKKAMENYLPHEVIYRPKTGFGAPLRSWLHSEQKLKPLMMDVLSTEAITKRGIFDARSVAELIEKDAKGSLDASYTIFSMMCIELWCRIFLDEDGCK